jgi:hypothetical protein
LPDLETDFHSLPFRFSTNIVPLALPGEIAPDLLSGVEHHLHLLLSAEAAGCDAAVELTDLMNLELVCQKFCPILRDRRKLHLVSGVVPDELLRFARCVEECLRL